MLQRIFHLERYGIELTRKVAAARQRMDIEVSSFSKENYRLMMIYLKKF